MSNLTKIFIMEIMVTMRRLTIILGIFATTILLGSTGSIELVEGSYSDNTRGDSLKITGTGDKITFEFQNGSKFKFEYDSGTYKTEKLSGDGSYILRISNEEQFELIDGATDKSIGTYKLYATPSLFKKLLSILVSSALVFSVIQAYLKVNKVWKRRKIVEVANSISIVAAMLGFAVGLPFLLNNIFITNDYFSAGKVILGLTLAVVFTLIGIGAFVDANRGVGFFTLLGRALNLERKESGELLSDMLRPKGARKIIDILKKLAAIDDDIAQEEIDLINQFSEKWNIEIPELKPGKPEEVTNLVELKALVQSYLDEGPDTDVAEGLVDLINLMAEADDEVTEEEAMAVAEFTGMIGYYVSAEKGGEMEMWEVNIVPQGDDQISAVREILPELDVVEDRGGRVFKVGRYFSEDYAEAVCSKYISLGLYSNTTKLMVDFSKVS